MPGFIAWNHAPNRVLPGTRTRGTRPSQHGDLAPRLPLRAERVPEGRIRDEAGISCTRSCAEVYCFLRVMLTLAGEAPTLTFFGWTGFIVEGLFSFLTGVLVPLAWPLVAITVALLFKKDISELLDRVMSFDGSAFKFRPRDQQGARFASESLPKPDSSEVSSGLDSEPNPDIRPWLDHINNVIANDASLGSVDHLKLELALANRRAHWESVGRDIYGSQIEALEALRRGALSNEALAPYFDTHVARAGNRAYRNICDWMSFLVRMSLVRPTQTGYEITDIGRSFYLQLIAAGFSTTSHRW